MNWQEKDGIYRPPMIAPAAMDEERLSKDRKSETRLRKEALRKASRSSLMKELANELEGRPDEVSNPNFKMYYGPILLYVCL